MGRAAALCVAAAAGPGDAPLAVGTEGDGVRLWDPRAGRAGAGGSGGGFPGLGDVPGVCFHPADSRRLFAGAGQRVLELDLRAAGGEGTAPVRTFEWSRDEVNQVTVNAKGTLLAAADDSGEAVVVDLEGGKLQKRLQGAHENICSSVQFRLRRPWEIITGGLDCRVVRWDFSKGRAVGLLAMEGGADGDEAGARVFNPPMAHSVSTASEREVAHLVAVGRGDGVVGVYDLDAAIAAGKAKPGGKAKEAPRLLGWESGGHRSGVSHVTFLKMAGEHRVLSVGNDRRLIMWDWRANSAAAEGGGPKCWEARHACVPNWACPLPGTTSIAVADVEGEVRLYEVGARLAA